jgi:hypothetical protein
LGRVDDEFLIIGSCDLLSWCPLNVRIPLMILTAKGEHREKKNTKIVLAIACLAVAALACNAAAAGEGETPDPTGLTSTPSPIVLVTDDFSSSAWGTGTDSDSSVEYVNNALKMIVYTRNYFVWSTPDSENYQDVHMEVTVINNDTDPSTSFGMICNMQTSTTNFYYFAIRPDGSYAISKASQEERDILLTNNNEWAASDLIEANAASYRLAVDCGHGTLALYVDGQQIDSVSDASYVSGQVALFTSSSENAITTNVSFDNFLMTELP